MDFRILSFNDKIHPLIADAEQFVLSSDYEGTPNALLEAMMMGLPCITTAFEGTSELLGDQPPCLVTPVGDGKAILDGKDISAHLPLMVLHADAWKVDGLVFRHAPSSGLMLCGSHHIIGQCEACENGDTGFLMCAFPGSSKQEWPAHNTFEHCTSHDNCDSAHRNADGFGAKLSIGEGNTFHACKAFHNIDDGFDCYTKDIIGPISPVRFTDCEAYNNGWLSGEKKPKEAKHSGSGFKLGGEQIKVAHVLVNCTSHHNARRGFDYNSNPAPILKECREWKNLR